MTVLQNRARAFENQYARQQELQFKAEARRNVMLGRWAAAAMKRADAETYAQNLAEVQINEPHRLLECLRRDFASAGVVVGDHELQTKMADLLQKATEEVLAA